MTLELTTLGAHVEAMGRELAARARQQADLVLLAREWLAAYSAEADALGHPARAFKAAIPTHESPDSIHRLPAVPDRFTVIAGDGSQIQPDRHGAAYYYVINVGSLVYRHGSGKTPEARSEPTLRYSDDDVYEDGQPVAGNLLDVRRDLAEITHLADRCVAEVRAGESGPTLAVVDGTLLLWVLKEQSTSWQRARVLAYLDQLDRVRGTGAAVAAFTSRPRHTDVTRLLHLAHVGGDVNRARQEDNPLQHVPDRAVFENLPAGARSGLFASSQPINNEFYEPAGHSVRFFYLNVAGEGEEPVIARVELPSWAAECPQQLALVHGALVDQARIAGAYPYALARADELAFIRGDERAALDEMVGTALLRAGIRPELSPKAYYKTQTRQRRRK